MDAPVKQDDAIEVTLRHESFGEYAFRSEPADLGDVMAEHIAKANAAASLKKAVDEVDQEQVKLAHDIATAERRVEAARMLEDAAAIEREVDAKSALEAQSQALSERRARLIDLGR